jgi:hypothetical protein
MVNLSVVELSVVELTDYLERLVRVPERVARRLINPSGRARAPEAGRRKLPAVAALAVDVLGRDSPNS